MHTHAIYILGLVVNESVVLMGLSHTPTLNGELVGIWNQYDDQLNIMQVYVGPALPLVYSLWVEVLHHSEKVVLVRLEELSNATMNAVTSRSNARVAVLVVEVFLSDLT